MVCDEGVMSHRKLGGGFTTIFGKKDLLISDSNALGSFILSSLEETLLVFGTTSVVDISQSKLLIDCIIDDLDYMNGTSYISCVI